MIINQLDIQAFRNLYKVSIQPHSKLNLIEGANGSGKSSVLEAIYCLSTGHSYRTRQYKQIISHSEDGYLLSAILHNPTQLRDYRCGLQRNRDGSVSLRLNFEEIKSIAPLTQLLAVKALTPESYLLIQGGPDERRQFLDWGVFHVEPSFIQAWKIFKRALSQRNQLLKERAPRHQVEAWNEQFVTAALTIDSLRKNYCKKLSESLTQRLADYQSMFHVKLLYQQGWEASTELNAKLQQNYSYHQRLKTTTDGPHRAELQILCEEIPAKQVLSRGQIKWLVYLLHLSQLDVLHDLTSKRTVLLCDDLTTELDDTFSKDLIQQVLCLDSQVFIAGVNVRHLAVEDNNRFHVKRGLVEKVV